MTLGETINKLLDECWRTGEFTSQAAEYIDQAIQHYKGESFWFNEDRATTNTVQGQKRYALPDDYQQVKTLSISDSDSEYELTRRTYEEMLELYPDDSEGMPTDYCIDRQEIWLGPVPNDAYTLRILYQREPVTATAEAQTNIFLDNANALIRAYAGKMLTGLVLRDAEAASLFAMIETQELQKLRGETTKRLMTGKPKRRS